MPVRLNHTERSFKHLFTQPSMADQPRGRADGVAGPVVGMFVASGDPTAAEICAGAGFDYLLLDAEHGPFYLEGLISQLRAIAAYPSLSVVRVPRNDAAIIKQVLDAGATSIMVPMVHTVEDARAAAAAMKYPQPGGTGASGSAVEGVRGVGSALARSARWGRVPQYLTRAHEIVSLIVQAESAEAVSNADKIAAVDGVDAVFLGPSDLAASMGYLGQQTHPEVVGAVKEVISKVRDAGKIVGVNAFDPNQARDYLDAGAHFVNVGADVSILARGTENLANEFMPNKGDDNLESY